MAKYIGKRLLGLVPILLGISFLTFLLLYLAPGDPAQKKLSGHGVAVSQETIDRTREEMGLNDSFMKQYVRWLGNVLHGDLGNSYKDGRPVAEKLRQAFGKSLVLALSSFLLALVISIPTGVLSAVYADGRFDRASRLLSFIGNSVPNFLLSVLLMYFLCLRMKLFPVIAKGTVQGLLLPTLALAIPMSARFVRQLRAEVLDELGKDYVTGMKVRGVKKQWILYHNVLRNSLPSFLTVIGISVGYLMGGSVVVESIFSWPGTGKLAMDAISNRDYPTIQGFVLMMAIIFVGINLLTDLSYHLLDRRISLE
jgi:peptide/nickel transport system permease protein